MPEYVGWTNITAPDNRHSGFSATVSERYASITLLNGATPADIFDPNFAYDDSFRVEGGSTSTTIWASIDVDFGAAYSLSKFRVWWGSSSNWGSCGENEPFAIVWGRLTTSSAWEKVHVLWVPPWGKTEYKEYSDFFLGEGHTYRYVKVEWRQEGTFSAVIMRSCGSMKGFGFYTGWFSDATEEQDFLFTDYTSTIANIIAPGVVEGYSPDSLADGNYDTEFRTSTPREVIFDLEKPHAINRLAIALNGTITDSINYSVYLFGSNSLNSWTNLLPGNGELYGSGSVARTNYPPVHYGTVGLRQEDIWVDLRGIILERYRYYKLLFSAQEPALVQAKIGYIGSWVYGEGEYAYGVSGTTITSIAETPGYQIESLTGATTIGQEENNWQLGPEYRFDIEENQALTGLVAGEYIGDYGDNVLELIPEVKGYTGLVASVEYAYILQGMAGFGRQANADISWPDFELEANTTEIAHGDMAPGWWEKSKVEGYTGALGTITYNLGVSGIAYPGVTTRAELQAKGSKVQALTGAIAQGSYKGSVDATALVHIIANLEEYIRLGTVEATAIVGQNSNGAVSYRYSMSASSKHVTLANANLSFNSHRCEGLALTGLIGKGSIDYYYDMNSDSTSDITATAALTMPGRRVSGYTQGSRFDNYILQYGAPL